MTNHVAGDPFRRHRLALALAAVALGLTACGTSTEPVDPAAPTPSDKPEVSPAAATDLCDMLRAETGNWQQQGPTVARVSYNGTVHNWALRHGAVNVALTRNRAVLDTVTGEQCPDVRDQVIAALDTPDLATGLLGY
ncbi:hypothetical protein [Nocardia neocaledoniensis]|uniref:hypothetical protein n=1 Tax=Nocardia neocaledoniensis TaxID=236511 RepID=UPI0024590780|nr:hypothetical protein [Nocardia neocaledoniensis]